MKLDLGCGPKCQPGFVGVDSRPFPGVEALVDLGFGPWPWTDGSIEEVRASHFLEHLAWPERIHFFNELYRVLEPGATAVITVPHWCNHRYYGDPTHQAPISEYAVNYLNREWREASAPHVPYTCDFKNASLAYSIHPALQFLPEQLKTLAIRWLKEAAWDMILTLRK